MGSGLLSADRVAGIWHCCSLSANRCVQPRVMNGWPQRLTSDTSATGEHTVLYRVLESGLRTGIADERHDNAHSEQDSHPTLMAPCRVPCHANIRFVILVCGFSETAIDGHARVGDGVIGLTSRIGFKRW